MNRLPLVSPIDRALFLKAQPYLDGVSSNVLTALASFSEERVYRVGEIIRPPGACIDRITFLGQGKIETLAPPASSSPARIVDAPGAIGLAHHFAHSDRPPGARALTEALCLEISIGDFSQILEDHFSLTLQMARATVDQVQLSIERLKENRPPESGYPLNTLRETPVQLNLVERLARVREAAFFSSSRLGVIAELVRHETLQRFAEGEPIWKEKDSADQMAIVLDGRFRSKGPFGECEVGPGAQMGAWDVLGEGQHVEGWVAACPSRTLSIPKNLLVDLLEDHFDFAESYLDNVSRYLLACWSA